MKRNVDLADAGYLEADNHRRDVERQIEFTSGEVNVLPFLMPSSIDMRGPCLPFLTPKPPLHDMEDLANAGSQDSAFCQAAVRASTFGETAEDA